MNIIIFSLFLSLHSKQIELPDYSIFVDAQFKCNSSNLNKFPWDKRYDRDPTKMAYKVWAVISDISFKEEKRETKKHSSRHRDFIFKHTGHAIFYCGKNAYISDKVKGDPFVVLPVIEDAFKRPGFIDLAGDDDSVAEGLSYIYELGYTDSPNELGTAGNTCIVKLEDFLKDPLSSLDINKLCKGESKKRIEFTKKEILRVAEILKTRMQKKNL